MAVMFLLLPTTNYLLLIPLLFSMSGLWLAWYRNLHITPGYRYACLLLISLLPAVLILVPVVDTLFEIFALQIPSAPISIFMLFLGLLLPVFYLADTNLHRKKFPLFAVLTLTAGIVVTSVAIHQEKPGKTRPMHSHLGYYLNADEGKAYWASGQPVLDDWTRLFMIRPVQGLLTEMYATSTMPFLKSKARAVNLAAPKADILKDSVNGESRFLLLRISSPRKAAHMEVAAEVKNPADMHGLTINGEKVVPAPVPTAYGSAYYFRYEGLPLTKDGLLEIRVRKNAPLQLALYDRSIGLPRQLIHTAMPEHVLPEQGGSSNVTCVKKTYRF
jgi:hypothetical protein